MEQSLELSTIPKSTKFNPDLLRRAVEEFTENGAWLLLSQVWYGARSYYDLAVALKHSSQPPEGEGGPPGVTSIEYQIIVDLQIQAFLYAGAEQFATLVRAVRRHKKATGAFFDAFVNAPADLRTLIDDVQDLTRTELTAIVGDPRRARRKGSPSTPILDPGAMQSVNVGGIEIPQDILNAHAFAGLVDRADEVIDLTIKNVAELRQFINPPEPIPGADRQPQALRAIDNSFRHGFRVLFHQASPTTRTFRIGAQMEAAEHPSVDLYLPGRGKSADAAINFGTVSCTEERTVGHLEALRQLSMRTSQLARGFLGYQTLGNPDFLLAACDLRLPAPDVD